MAKKQVWGWKYRKFNGKDYRIGEWFTNKSDARKRAEFLRSGGYLARVTQEMSNGKKMYVTWGRFEK